MPANKVETIFNWYFRFNGFYIIDNFTIHKDYKKLAGGGESDILAVRFPYSHEKPRNFPFLRDNSLLLPDKIDFIIAEIKSSRCEINAATLNRDYGNMQYVIKCMGFLSDEGLIEKAAEQLYSDCVWQDEASPYSIRLISCGAYENENLREEHPKVFQITLNRAINFLNQRFNTGCNQINRSNWDERIQKFAELCGEHVDIDILTKWVLSKNS